MLILLWVDLVDLLDPGLSRRPSRFDRKYLFPLPSLAERTQYCSYWRSKLHSNPDLEFPEALCPRISAITDHFSFAYLKEAFVATLLVLLVGRKGRLTMERGCGLEELPLWREIKRQVELLRGELEDGAGHDRDVYETMGEMRGKSLHEDAFPLLSYAKRTAVIMQTPKPGKALQYYYLFCSDLLHQGGRAPATHLCCLQRFSSNRRTV